MKVTVNLNNDLFRNLSGNFSKRVVWIKKVREMTGMGLKQTKDILDAAFPFTASNDPFDGPLEELTTQVEIDNAETFEAIRKGIASNPELKTFISIEEKPNAVSTRQALIKAVTAGLKNGEFEAAKKVIELLEVL